MKPPHNKQPLMNPISSSSPKTPTKSPDSSSSLLTRSFSNSLNSVIFHHSLRRTWLLVLVLSLQIILFITIKTFPLSLSPSPRRRHDFPSPLPRHHHNHSPKLQPDQCESGRVYVYELPPSLNHELIKNCDQLNPWSSRCDALVNDGFGPPATGISRILPENIAPAWYWTDQFVSEIIFHNRIINHKCRTDDPALATGFYVPFYAGLAVGKYLWRNYSSIDRDRHCRMLLDWIHDKPAFRNSNGWNHFMTMGRISWDFRRSKDQDWGSSCIYLPGMRNITRLLIEKNPWDYFDVGIPYPTGFHPRSDSDILSWQEFVRTKSRTKLFCFAGAQRGKIKDDFRGLLLSHCRNESDACREVNCAGSRCSNGTTEILESFLDSDFCLQPRGDSFTRRSIFDCMIAGSIPVFFWHRTAYYQYEWFLPREAESYSVYIDRNAVKNGTSIRSVLEKYSKEDVRKMREKVIESIPKFVYAKPKEGLESIKDAFDIALDGVLKRFKEQEGWFKWR
ncbi:hypothetical protein ACFE04_027057 [Oxalis oulophora]